MPRCGNAACGAADAPWLHPETGAAVCSPACALAVGPFSDWFGLKRGREDDGAGPLQKKDSRGGGGPEEVAPELGAAVNAALSLFRLVVHGTLLPSVAAAVEASYAAHSLGMGGPRYPPIPADHLESISRSVAVVASAVRTLDGLWDANARGSRAFRDHFRDATEDWTEVSDEMMGAWSELRRHSEATKAERETYSVADDFMRLIGKVRSPASDVYEHFDEAREVSSIFDNLVPHLAEYRPEAGRLEVSRARMVLTRNADLVGGVLAKMEGYWAEGNLAAFDPPAFLRAFLAWIDRDDLLARVRAAARWAAEVATHDVAGKWQGIAERFEALHDEATAANDGP